MMRAVRTIVKCVGLAVAVVGLLLFIGFRFGLTPLPKPPAGVRLEPLRPPLQPEEINTDNAAHDYLLAARLVSGYEQSAESEKQMDALMSGDFSGDTAAIEQTLRDCHDAMALVRQGTRVEFCQMPWQRAAENFSDRFKPLRLLARLLVCTGNLAERAGDYDLAFSNHLAVLKLGRDCGKGGPVLPMLVGYAITSMGAQSIRGCLARYPGPLESLENVQRELLRLASDGQPSDETLRYELRYSKETCEHTLAGYKGLAIVASIRSYRGLADAAFGELIADEQRPYPQRNPRTIMRKWTNEGRPSWTWMWNRPVPRILLSMLLPALESTGQRALRANLEIEAAVVTCALKRYTVARCEPPAQLADLVPQLLASIPTDPFDGNPLRYRRDGDDWVLWSVGSDTSDNNAEWHQFKYRKRGEAREGGDIFFRSTEARDDLAAYKAAKTRKE